jgi:hypothetical protein
MEDARVEVRDVQEVINRGEEKVFAEDVGVEEGAFDRQKVEAWDIEEIEVVCVPTGSEKCDGIDNDCDGQTDEEGAQGCVYFYVDNDRDGFGDEATKKCLCAPTEPYTLTVGGDCDDQNAQINPSAVERCGNGLDDNCDGRTDEAGCQECSLYYKDQDADGFGVTSDSRCLREATAPYTAIRGGDCDDNDATINPGAAEKCNDKDDNCNGATDEEGAQGCVRYFYDFDGDNFGISFSKCLCAPDPQTMFTALNTGDCNDNDPNINPSAIEKCNNKDDNCDGQIDEERTSGQCGTDGYTLYYYDGDGDTYGVTGDTKCLCSPSGRYNVTRGGDCDDGDAWINPDGVEVCDGKDNNCDAVTDPPDSPGCVTYYHDADNDTYGTSQSQCLCSPTGNFRATSSGDCNDNDPQINPDATEKCDGIDNNCNGQTDEERTSGQCGIDGYTLYYYDGDGDTYGVTGDTKCLCSPSGKYNVTRGGDCDDGDALINPDGVEVCDGKDNNCDGVTDPPNTPGCATYYYDGDNDTYGTSQSQCLCSPSGNFRATRPGDCDDTDERVHPGGSVCGIDGDCDGSLLDPGEVCDDGNSVRWDGCTDCRYLEFQVNTWTTNDQVGPSVTWLPNGGFVVVWTSGCWQQGCTAQDGSGGGVYGQRFDSNGNKVGSEFRVNTWTTDEQTDPSITSLSNGGFVVVWQSWGQDGDWYGVYGQRFDSNGDKVGSEFQVNTWTSNHQESPSITSLSNGGFVVVWHSDGQDGSEWGVYGQRFDSNGNKVASEFQVNTWTTSDQWHPSITSLSNGGFVVVWESDRQDGSDSGVYGQRFDSNGNKVGSEFQVNTWTTNEQSGASITSLSNGGFVVVWQSGCYGSCTPQDGSNWGVYGRRFDSNGNKVGSEFRVNTWTTGDQYAGPVTSLRNGGFVVVWESYGQDGSDWGVYGQRFDSNGAKVGSEFQVNTWTTDDQGGPSITSLPNGGFVVVWTSGCSGSPCTNPQDGSSDGVYGRVFSQ